MNSVTLEAPPASAEAGTGLHVMPEVPSSDPNTRQETAPSARMYERCFDTDAHILRTMMMDCFDASKRG